MSHSHQSSTSKNATNSPFAFLIAKFLKDELHTGDVVDDYQESYDDELTKPSDENSTELGKVPHDPRKGSNYFGSMQTGRTGFGMMQEDKK